MVLGTNAWKIRYGYFGNRLTQLRTDAGLTQTMVARCMGMPLRVYSAYEKGFFIPPLETARSLAKYFDVTTVELLGGGITTEDLVLARANDELLQLFDGYKGQALPRLLMDCCDNFFEDDRLARDEWIGIIYDVQHIVADATLRAMRKFTPYSRRGDDWDSRCAKLQEAVDRLNKKISDRSKEERRTGKFPALNAEEDGALPESEGSCGEETVSTA